MAKFKKYNREDFSGRSSDRSGGFRARSSDRPRGGFGRGNDRPRGGFRGRDEERPRSNYGRRNFDRGEGSEKEMFDVICDKCGKECKVPFKPTRGKPVYCSECFANKEEGSSHGGSSRDLEEINRKLDRIMRFLKID